MNKTQKGFALIEGLLIILILVILGFAGYYVWHTQRNADRSLNNADKSSQSTPISSSQNNQSGQKQIEGLLDNTITFDIPNNWQTASPSSFCVGTDSELSHECLDSLEISPTDAKGAQTGDGFGVEINAFKNANNKTAKAWFFDTWCGCLESSDWSDKAIQVNGYDAMHATQHDSQYVDEYYVIRSGSTILMVNARTKDTSTTAVQTGTTKDYTKYNQQINDVATSIKLH